MGAVQCVVPPGQESAVEAIRASWSGPARLLEPVPGGATRQESVRAGLVAVCDRVPGAEWVVVHDAARCLVEPADAEAVLEAARGTGAAVPVVPIPDMVKEVAGSRVVRTLERASLAAAQTPQAFRVSVLLEAHEKAAREGYTATDCASLVERLGVEVRTLPGRAGNWKVTWPADLERAESLLSRASGGLRS